MIYYGNNRDGLGEDNFCCGIADNNADLALITNNATPIDFLRFKAFVGQNPHFFYIEENKNDFDFAQNSRIFIAYDKKNSLYHYFK